MRRSPVIFAILLMGVCLRAGAQQTKADSLHQEADSLAADSLEEMSADSAAADSGLVVRAWDFHPSLGSRAEATDSTLRWEVWPDWTYRKSRDPGAITYRLGTIGRSNAVQTGAQEARYQQLYWENISMNDPLSGTVHWQLIPHHKILTLREEDVGAAARSRYYLKPYYLVKPLSRISYEESAFESRSLEFMVSHNLSRRTNLELSYWDRRGGGEYPNSKVTGRQIFTRLFHQLNRREALKLQFSNDAYTTGQPFGYLIPNPLNYNFDRFSALAREPSAESELSSSVLALQYYRRPADSADTENNFQAGIYYRRSGRLLEYSADSVSYALPTFGASARRWWRRGAVRLEAGAGTRHLLRGGSPHPAYGREYLGSYSADATLAYRPFSFLELRAGGSGRYRSDGFGEYRVRGTAVLEWKGGPRITAGASAGSRMPTPQQLYWSSAEFSGNPGLEVESWQEMNAELSWEFLPGLSAETRLQAKNVGDPVMVGPDSVFANSRDYWSTSATAGLAYEHPHLEISSSATLHGLAGEGAGWDGTYGGREKKKLWLRGSVYWKGYVFDRAAYVKAGLSGMASPLRYQPDHYNPVLDFWQPRGAAAQLPRFHRLDLDLSARVRTIMVVIRWENVLDDLTQAGYFETSGYPMSSRRFLFGIRALFRN